MFDLPLNNEFTQGTVFSCAYAENYCAPGILGLVITARCDAAQNKVPVFSYVPVIPLHRWMLYDGALLVLERIEADLINTIGNYLRDFSISESILRVHDLANIYSAHIEKFEADRSRKNRCEKLKLIIGDVQECRNIKACLHDSVRLNNFIHRFDDKVTSLIRELTENKLAGYYLLRDLDPLREADGSDFVALLREVHHIPAAIAKLISKGAHKEVFVREDLSCPVFRGDDEIAIPVCRLKSPWIEHLMQRFTFLFARIGVRSNDYRDVKKSLSRIRVEA